MPENRCVSPGSALCDAVIQIRVHKKLFLLGLQSQVWIVFSYFMSSDLCSRHDVFVDMRHFVLVSTGFRCFELEARCSELQEQCVLQLQAAELQVISYCRLALIRLELQLLKFFC